MPDIISQFKALKLHGMAECYTEIQAQNPELIDSAKLLLRQLLAAEVTDRSIRTIRYQLGSANNRCTEISWVLTSANPLSISR